MKINVFLGPIDSFQEFPMHYAGCGMYAYNFTPSEDQKGFHAYVCEAGVHPLWEQSDVVKLVDQTVFSPSSIIPKVVSITPVTEQQLSLYISPNEKGGYKFETIAPENADVRVHVHAGALEIVSLTMTFQGNGTYAATFNPRRVGKVEYTLYVSGWHADVKLISSASAALPELEALTEAAHV
jgi:hypothetical protein